VLIHGSGPADEDETVAAVKVFRDLAYGLAAQGIASIRYPKRAALHPALFAASKPFTVKEEVTDDVQAALTSLSGTPGVDPKRLWLVGHSLGATLAPRIARENRLVSGIVILAGAVRPVEELLVEQMETIKSRDSAEFKAAQSTARAVRNPNLKPTDAVDVLGSKLPGSYFLDLRDYRPAEVAAALTIPILVLQGARDYQIPPSEFGLWKKRLRGRPRTALRLYPTLNHLFVAGSGPSTPAEYSKPAHVDGEAIKDIARFILSPPQAK
jgi:dienelactone hydrolase